MHQLRRELGFKAAQVPFPPGVTQSHLQVFASQEFLLQFGQRVRLFFILKVPDWNRILQRLVDAQEQVDDVLPVWITKVVGQMPLDRGNQLAGCCKEALLLTKLGMMCDRSAILHRDLITHLIIHASHFQEQLRLHLDVLIVSKTKLLKLHQSDTIADDLLCEVSPIETVNTVGTNSATLNIDAAKIALALPIRAMFHSFVIRQPLARETGEEISGLQEACHMGEQVERECLLLPLPSLYIVVEESYFQRVWQLLVERQIHKVAILASHSLFSGIVGLCKVEAVKRVAVLLKESSKMLSSGNSILVYILVKNNIWLRAQRVWYLSPEERNGATHLNK